MDKKKFIENFKHAFGSYELPIVFWYSDKPISPIKKTRGCYIGDLKAARNGGEVSFNLDTISCPGGKLYAGFSDAHPNLGDFVSGKEHYKESPKLLIDFISNLYIENKSTEFINFASINNFENFENIEGLIFFASPDVLSGLVSWVLYDTNKADAVSVPFGSGCSSIISETIAENRNNGERTFLGIFDPSVRPQVEANVLSLAIPMSRFKKLYHTINASCLQGTHAWRKVKQRIENEI